MKIIHHPEAELELIEAAQYYERKLSTLGGQFLDEMDRAVRAIVEGPHRSRVVEGDVRRCLVRRFPYAVYYRALPDHVQILAFKHHARHPDYWRSRLQNDKT